MNRIALALSALSLLIAGESAIAGKVVNGVEGGPAAVAQPNSFSAADLAAILNRQNIARIWSMFQKYESAGVSTPGATLVTFDDMPAPCSFAETTALRGQVEGVIFAGIGNNGGGVLRQCAGFGVPALSPPNFLAFNPSASFADGGLADIPQLALYLPAENGVTLSLSGGGEPDTLAVVAIDDGMVQDVQVVSVPLSEYTTVTVSGPVSVLLITGDESVTPFLVDNIESF